MNNAYFVIACIILHVMLCYTATMYFSPFFWLHHLIQCFGTMLLSEPAIGKTPTNQLLNHGFRTFAGSTRMVLT